MRTALCCIGILALLAFPTLGQSAPTVTLNWGASTTAGVSYNVYRETSPGACTPTSVGTDPGCLKLNSSPLSVLTFTDSAPPTNAKSYYVVRSMSTSRNRRRQAR
jgi:hypothetical protein